MNCSTGHLRSFSEVEIDAMCSSGHNWCPPGYTPVPEHLSHAATQALAGRNEATISLTSGGKLSKWAANQRKARKQMQKESRRRNRN